MNKTFKIAGILVSVLLLWQIGRCFYMVLCISCTTPPIKTYNYDGSMDQLENNFISFSKRNQAVRCDISHRGIESYAARDIRIKMKIDVDSILCNLVIYQFNDQTKLDIDEIYDITNNTGGNNVDSSNVKELLDKFDKHYLIRFQKNQNIKLTKPFF